MIAFRIPQELYPARDAAKLIGRSRSTLRRLTYSGQIPAYRYGRDLCYRRRDLQAYIDSRPAYNPANRRKPRQLEGKHA